MPSLISATAGSTRPRRAFPLDPSANPDDVLPVRSFPGKRTDCPGDCLATPPRPSPLVSSGRNVSCFSSQHFFPPLRFFSSSEILSPSQTFSLHHPLQERNSRCITKLIRTSTWPLKTAETRQNGVGGKRSADGELAEDSLAKKSNWRRVLCTTQVSVSTPLVFLPQESRLLVIGAGVIRSLLVDGLTVAGSATPGAADTSDDEIDRMTLDVDAGDIARNGLVPLTDDQRKMTEAALMMGLRPDCGRE